jgi:hypothetical protein
VTTTELPDISGNPNISKKSNTYVERQNLTIKISMRRFKRLVNALSKKADKLKSAVVLYFGHYNYIRIQGTFRAVLSTKARIDNRMWSFPNLTELVIYIRKHPNRPVC